MECTKGKWEDKLSVTGERIIYVETEDNIEVICRGVRHFNAPIIKAAPEMYEVLKEVLEHVEDENIPRVNGQCTLCKTYRDKIRRILALTIAEGGKNGE